MPAVGSEQHLWQGLSRGEASAFEHLYREHAARVRSFLRHCLGDAQSAQDVTQEIFLALWRNPNGFDPGRGTLRAYIFGIARKQAADWWRHHPPAELAPPDSPVSGSETTLMLADALGQLEPDLRGLLWLREAEGYSYAELAGILDVPVGTVKSRLFTAREQLRQVWRRGGRPA